MFFFLSLFLGLSAVGMAGWAMVSFPAGLEILGKLPVHWKMCPAVVLTDCVRELQLGDLMIVCENGSFVDRGYSEVVAP